MDALRKMAAQHGSISEVRGMGFMIGIEMGAAAKEAVPRLLKKGIITNAAHDTVLRILPPFIIEKNHVDAFLSALDTVLEEIEAGS
jgi:acetylornithine/N-succinyldiaminopimelate aminotransferase